MAKNTGKGHRTGAVRNRTQTRSGLNGPYVKRDSNTGRFIDRKSDNKPFKGVTKEK